MRSTEYSRPRVEKISLENELPLALKLPDNQFHSCVTMPFIETLMCAPFLLPASTAS